MIFFVALVFLRDIKSAFLPNCRIVSSLSIKIHANEQEIKKTDKEDKL